MHTEIQNLENSIHIYNVHCLQSQQFLIFYANWKCNLGNLNEFCVFNSLSNREFINMLITANQKLYGF